MQLKFLGMLKYKNTTKLVKIISLLHVKDLHIHQLIEHSLLGSLFKHAAEE